MSYQVTVMDVRARPTAVVPATTTWQEFPTLWRELLNEVWMCLRAGGVTRGCRNIMLYTDDVPHVEVGVELREVLVGFQEEFADHVVHGRLACARASGQAPSVIRISCRR